MVFDAVVSTAMFAALLWSVRFLMPRAIAAHDRFALFCALITAALALVAWGLLATRLRS